jgi:translation initiation factor 1A
MPSHNIRGGKSYKKNKKGGGEDNKEKKFFGRDEDQDYARVLKLLGNRRLLCFCNDGYDRVCKIRGALCKGPKKDIIDVGDIVLVSMREPDNGSDEDKPTAGETVVHASGRKEVYDVLMKYSRSHWRNLRKEENIHKHLLLSANSNEDELFEDVKEEGVEEGGESEEVDISAI